MVLGREMVPPNELLKCFHLQGRKLIRRLNVSFARLTTTYLRKHLRCGWLGSTMPRIGTPP